MGVGAHIVEQAVIHPNGYSVLPRRDSAAVPSAADGVLVGHRKTVPGAQGFTVPPHRGGPVGPFQPQDQDVALRTFGAPKVPEAAGKFDLPGEPRRAHIAPIRLEQIGHAEGIITVQIPEVGIVPERSIDIGYGPFGFRPRGLAVPLGVNPPGKGNRAALFGRSGRLARERFPPAPLQPLIPGIELEIPGSRKINRVSAVGPHIVVLLVLHFNAYFTAPLAIPAM